MAEYVSAANRGPHIRSWAPRPNRPIGERWLVAADRPEDMNVIAEAVAR